MKAQQAIKAAQKPIDIRQWTLMGKIISCIYFQYKLKKHSLSMFTTYYFLQEADIISGIIFPIQQKNAHFNSVFSPALRMHLIYTNKFSKVMLKYMGQFLCF